MESIPPEVESIPLRATILPSNRAVKRQVMGPRSISAASCAPLRRRFRASYETERPG